MSLAGIGFAQAASIGAESEVVVLRRGEPPRLSLVARELESV